MNTSVSEQEWESWVSEKEQFTGEIVVDYNNPASYRFEWNKGDVGRV
jgi:hypothetical protein